MFFTINNRVNERYENFRRREREKTLDPRREVIAISTAAGVRVHTNSRIVP